MISSKFIILGFLLVLISGALGHSYLTKPTSRGNQHQSQAGCRGPSCLGPCDKPLAQAITSAVTIQRGASINPQWPRNNHAGGFIRFAWAKTSDSDTHAAFDAGVQEIVCHEIGGCKPDDPQNPNGGDSGPSDGSSQPCQTTITVPLHLTDGAWTLQWAWFGGAFSLGDYYSCVDYIISGGPTAPKQNALFIGGDYSHPNQNQCKFFNTDRLHQCTNEPCNNPVFPVAQEQAGVPFGFSANSVVQSSTTGSQPIPVVHSTTGSSPVATTASAAPTPVPVSVPLTTGSTPVIINGPNCGGYSTLSTSTISLTSVDSWSNQFHMIFDLHVHESTLNDWMIEIVWPSNAVNTQVVQSFNGGSIQCQATSPEHHAMIKPVASWANNLPSGYVLTIEVTATNTNMNNDFIKANTQFRVYKK